MFCALMGVSAWRRWHEPLLAICPWSLGGLMGGVGVRAPRLIRPIYTGLIWITFRLGWALSHVLLFLLYFLVIAPVGALDGYSAIRWNAAELSSTAIGAFHAHTDHRFPRGERFRPAGGRPLKRFYGRTLVF